MSSGTHGSCPARTFRRGGLPSVLLAALLSVVVGCGGGEDPARGRLQSLVEAEDWTEVRANVELLRQEGVTGAWVDLAEGLALLHQNADREAERLFEKAAARDSSLAPRIAEAWQERALEDHGEGWDNRAKERMAQALIYAPTLDPGPLLDPVADHFYRFTKEFDRAYPLYLRLYRERPEPEAKHPEWVYRYGYCLEQEGFLDSAMGVYEEFIETWPEDRDIMRFVQWRYMSGLLEQAERARAEARPDAALELLRRCLDSGWHMDLQQQARYLAGEIEEERGRLVEAREWYDRVVADGNRFGGDVVAKARERLDALGVLGVH